MAGRIYNLGPELLNPFEIGAMLLAVLAWPAPDEVEEQQRGAEALAALTVLKTCEALPEEADRLRKEFPEYVAVGLAEIKARLRTLRRRLRDRMVAARMALGFMEEGLTGRPPRLPESMKRLSLNELSVLVQSDILTVSDPEMIERRVWRESRAVIALAVAFQVCARAEGSQATHIGYPLDDGELHAAIIELARLHEPLVLGDPRFGVGEEDLIQVRQLPSRLAA